MMKKIKFEITWEDVQHIAERDGSLILERRGCELLKEIESGVRGWFEASKWDAISDSLTCAVVRIGWPDGVNIPEPRDHNDAEGVVTMRDLA